MKIKRLLSITLLLGSSLLAFGQQTTDEKVANLVKEMTLEEKIGQMNQNSYFGLDTKQITTLADKELDDWLQKLGHNPAKIQKMSHAKKVKLVVSANDMEFDKAVLAPIRRGEVGSLLNVVDPVLVNRIQRAAVEDSRLGIPLIIARDVIHGYKTIFPIPLGQAASFNPDLVEEGGQVAAKEARSVGVQWTFAPMLDISRDARWGRIAESFGEDPYLTSVMGVAMVDGFQGKGNLSSDAAMAACVKHFVGYGASEGGRDYNSTNIPAALMHNVYLSPFETTIKSGAATLMTSFNDNDGIPSSGNGYLLDEVLRGKWGFKGVVVSDWASIAEMIAHGFSKDTKHAAELSANALLDIDMVSQVYLNHLPELVKEGKVKESDIDGMVTNILRLKFDLGLFDNPYVDIEKASVMYADSHLDAAERAAVESAVLLKNEGNTLPLAKGTKVAIIGPMADAPHDQMGTWVFDGEKERTVTPLKALQSTHSAINYVYEPALRYSRDENTSQFEAAKAAVRESDVAVVFVGEESILSGEAHSLSDINLIGKQSDLLAAVKSVGKPVVMVVMAGRPLTIERDLAHADAVLYNFHPGTMGGPAILDLLFGKENPSGKLPTTFVREVGQIPMYYNHNNTGRPAPSQVMTLKDIALEAGQTSLGNTSFYLDSGRDPLFPFGYGLSYTTFSYTDLNIYPKELAKDGVLNVSVTLTNNGNRDGKEVVQVYVRDLVGSVVRPVKELKRFKKVELKAGESRQVTFTIPAEELGFYNAKGDKLIESGDFKIWVGTDSSATLGTDFEIK
ncbi:beta-glucosidase BglX [Bacteroides propionicifaciens]|uniref:beta-glucosidase BglX n=1 Tax=Bacteroides propionicifaciens TaxID=392838 RepID=UPI00037814F8|nr:beta-glucosidase BglX [Bacteroides propionicifaciens]